MHLNCSGSPLMNTDKNNSKGFIVKLEAGQN